MSDGRSWADSTACKTGQTRAKNTSKGEVMLCTLKTKIGTIHDLILPEYVAALVMAANTPTLAAGRKINSIVLEWAKAAGYEPIEVVSIYEG